MRIELLDPLAIETRQEEFVEESVEIIAVEMYVGP
jgi:hypothetical protein